MYQPMAIKFDVNQATRVRALLVAVLEDQEREWRLLNTLSFLEHIGSRKIFQSHSHVASVCGSVLKHLAEETRHAALLKRAAESIAGHSLGFSPQELLGHRYARSYFDRLDAVITRDVGQSNAYSSMSYVIEVRALWFYALYQELLAASGRRLNLKGLVTEERRHLDEMAKTIRSMPSEPSNRLASFLELETSLFDKLLTAMERGSV